MYGYSYCLWYSTDITQAGRAVDYYDVVDSFVSQNKDLHLYKMSSGDWDAISMVMSWLKIFCAATMEMSMSKKPMLSTMHTIFCGLQDDIKSILVGLPNLISLEIKKGLTDVHLKLSDYYHKSDKSPFYIWSSCKSWYPVQ
ncbi:hypothetical protein EDD85DRAFT_770203 [Armillaria nabsnona]|nr:hypothetical protein EDD85DRAFT_770203 [Armillaria nabsnona]